MLRGSSFADHLTSLLFTRVAEILLARRWSCMTKDSIFGPRGTGDWDTISEEGGVATCRIGQMHIFWGRSHFPQAF